MINRNRFILILSGILIVAASLKIGLFLTDAISFNSDEAIVALMAKHILEGGRPVFFFGQAYMGSLDAYLVAFSFWLLGETVWAIRIVQLLLYLGTIVTTVWVGRVVFNSDSIGLIAGGLLAIPTVNVTLYTTASLGGYGEALLIGNLILLVGWQLKLLLQREFHDENIRPNHLLWFVYGGLVGLGLWANGLTLIYSIPSVLILIYSFRRQFNKKHLVKISIGLTGFFLGSLAWWVYAFQFGLNSLIFELLGSAVSVETGSFLQRVGQHIYNGTLLGSTVLFGLRPPWSTDWLALPLIPLIILFYGLTFIHWIKMVRSSSSERNAFIYLAGVVIVLIAGFIFTSFGVDPSGRYFIPINVMLSVIAASMIVSLERPAWIKAGLVTLVLLFQLWGNYWCAKQNPPGITTQFYEPAQIDRRYDRDLILFLISEGETRGYSNYWVTYPLAFQTSEIIIFSPRLPYHLDLRYSERDDRIPAYTEIVENSDKVAYITTNNPELDDLLHREFSNLGVTWKEKIIGDYRIYYQLSQLVEPSDIGFK